MKMVDRYRLRTSGSRSASMVGIVVCALLAGCTGGVNGPVVASDWSSGGEDAEVLGEVVVEGDCLYVFQSEVDTRYPVIWPPGTEWDAEESAVVLPDGTRIPAGTEVYGGGGYHSVDKLSDVTTSDGVALVSSCVDNEYGEIAVFNATGDIEIRP